MSLSQRWSFMLCQQGSPSFCLFKEEYYQPIHTTHRFAMEKFQTASALLSRANSLIAFSAASRVISIASFKTCWCFSRRLFMVILIQGHNRWGS